MGSYKKHVAVIGAGVSGICSIVMLKEENIEPVCFEKTDKCFGTWSYREKSTIGVPSIMPTTILNISKEMGAFSDFPPSKDYSVYMKHSDVNRYLMEYATHKDALRHVRFNSEVVEVKRCHDYEETGKWIVTVKHTMTGDTSSKVYDGVLICVGNFNRPKWPTYPGMETFMGQMLHSHSLKGVAEYENKNVLVVGMGSSALDAAVEISSVAKQVYLSTRSGAHVITRQGFHGYPFDYIILRRFNTILLNILPFKISSWFIENLILDPKFNHRLYPVQPEWSLLSKDPVVNDHLGIKILSGVIQQHKDIKRFTENGVVFVDEDEEIKVDVVVMGTGYTFDFPFLEEGVLIKEDGRIDLYKGIWPPHLEHSTLAFIGFLLAFAPAFPIIEMQARWVAHILAGKGNLPSKWKMTKDIQHKHQRNVSRYAPSEKQTLRADYQPYMDEVAEQLGVKPNLFKLMVSDPRLFLKMALGPVLSYQYRLEGPHSWKGAREAILTCDERMHYPLKKYMTQHVENPFLIIVKKVLLLFPFI